MGKSFVLGINPMAHVWHSYNRAVQRHPLLVNMATSGALWAAGDTLSQVIQRRPTRCRQSSDGHGEEGGIQRTACTGAFGGLVFGPLGHAWYTWLHSLALAFGVPGSMRYIIAKTLADNIIFTPVYVGLFMAFSSLLISRSGPAATANRMQKDFLPTVAAEGVIWPPIMAMLFKCIPLSHQLLAVNAITVADVAFLAWLEDHDVSELTSALVSPFH